jgi:diacylglycerol O-acyltransferase
MDDSMGNRFGLVFLDLPINEKANESRFRGLEERMDALEGAPDAFVAFGIPKALGHTPVYGRAHRQRRVRAEGHPAGDQRPGPPRALYIDRKRVRHVTFWVPHRARLGLGLSIMSYAGKVIVGVRMDEAVSKHPARLVELLEEEASVMLQKANHSY